MVDSGGFALMGNPNSHWGLRQVSRLTRQLNAEIFVSLDYPPARRDSLLERRHKIEISVRNFRTLRERFPQKIVMPVVHGRTFAEIDLSVELIASVCSSPTWIGLGGIVPLLQRRLVSGEVFRVGAEVFIAGALKKIREAFPSAAIHAFGAGGTQTFPALFALGADSADSIGWRQAAGFGSIFLPLRSQRAIRWNVEKRPPRKLLDDRDLRHLEICKCPICREQTSLDAKLSTLQSGFHNRSIHNAWTIVHQTEYWPSGRRGMKLLISRGDFCSGWTRALDES